MIEVKVNWSPLPPNGLLKPCNLQEVDEDFTKYQEFPEKYTARMRFLEIQFTMWWMIWFNQVFSILLPFKKWDTKHRNLKIDYIVLVR